MSTKPAIRSIFALGVLTLPVALIGCDDTKPATPAANPSPAAGAPAAGPATAAPAPAPAGK